jgi:hypothetical protein
LDFLKTIKLNKAVSKIATKMENTTEFTSATLKRIRSRIEFGSKTRRGGKILIPRAVEIKKGKKHMNAKRICSIGCIKEFPR